MKRTTRSNGLALLVLALFCLGMVSAWAQSPANLPAEVVAYADLVFYNGQILTGDESFTIVEAVAIRDGKFLARGNNDRILSMAGPRTRRIDLEGQSVVPGFIDTHLHSAFLGNIAKRGTDGRVEFEDVTSGLEELRELVSQYPAGKQLYLAGPSNRALLLEVTLAQLDAAAPNNPISISCPNNQNVVNSLLLARIPADTPGILKDENGNPTGQLRGGAAGIIKYEMMPWPDVDEMVEAQKLELERYVVQGLTTIEGRGQGLTISVFRDLRTRGELVPRIRLSFEFLRENGSPEAYLKRLGNLTDFGDNMLKFFGATVQVVDGSGGAYTADFPKIRVAESSPYDRFGQNKWEETGDVATSDRRNILLANRYGWTITSMHSQGDQSNDELLKVYEEAHQENPLNGRHFAIDHGDMWRPRHLDLLKEMEVIPSVFTFPISRSEGYLESYGADALHQMLPVKSLIEAGIYPAAEADTRPPNSAPLFQMKNFITRKDPNGRVWNPDEKISRQQALHMYGLWAARYTGEEDILGSIENGKLADLVVLGGDFLTFPEDELDKLRVLMTVIDGKVAYEAPGAF